VVIVPGHLRKLDFIGRTEEQKNRRTEEQKNRRTEEQKNRRTEEQKNRKTEKQKNRRTEEQKNRKTEKQKNRRTEKPNKGRDSSEGQSNRRTTERNRHVRDGDQEFGSDLSLGKERCFSAVRIELKMMAFNSPHSVSIGPMTVASPILVRSMICRLTTVSRSSFWHSFIL
jgi:flagellar biosynthesis GTPase FlhF